MSIASKLLTVMAAIAEHPDVATIARKHGLHFVNDSTTNQRNHRSYYPHKTGGRAKASDVEKSFHEKGWKSTKPLHLHKNGHKVAISARGNGNVWYLDHHHSK